MGTLSTRLAGWLPVAALLIAIASIQTGASVAKSLFPLVGASGVTALRLALACLILLIIFRPWRLRFPRQQWLPLLLYGLSLGAMNYLFYLAIRTIPLGMAVALEFTGPLAVALLTSRRAIDFLWVILVIAGLGSLLPLAGNVAQLDLTGTVCALGAGAGWAIYILSGKYAGTEHAAASVSLGTLIAAVVFVPLGAMQAGAALWHWSVLPLGLCVAVLSTALPYSLEMLALTRLPARTIGTLLSLEPAMAALSGMVFLGETLSFSQSLAILCIIIASAGATLTMRRQTKIKRIEIDS